MFNLAFVIPVKTGISSKEKYFFNLGKYTSFNKINKQLLVNW
jgi:hypothetical protein